MNWTCGMLTVGCVWLSVQASLAGQVDFNFQIRPLLSDRCYKCHGPDEKSRKAKLRLDAKEGLYRELGEGWQVVNPGNPAKSEAYRRLTTTDPEDLMPPSDSGLSLSEEEIGLVREWIEEGAEWKSHWAFLPVSEVVVPAVQREGWVRNDVDRFVLARLEAEELVPAAEVAKERLLRRVTFDLTGLPPTLPEVDAFLADDTADAYARVVDRLLASSSYGERLALEWLDVARYADTYGYQADRFNHLWPWRDWVIEAFNSNLAYDDFIVWQIAGDLLPGAGREQYLATAFNRNHRQTNEGGSVNEEYRVEYNADRVHTTGTAFLGLTLECARCHDHKYDPVTQREYYQFMAFFNSTDESGLYSHFTDAIPNPTLLLYREGEKARHEELGEQITRAEQDLAARANEVEESFRSWLEQPGLLEPLGGLVGNFSFDVVASGMVSNSAAAELPGRLTEGPQEVEGRFGGALEFSGENSVEFKGVGEFGRTDSFSFGFWVWIPEERPEIILLHRSKAGSDAGSRGYQIQLEAGQATFALIHFWPGNAIQVRTKEKLPQQEWVHLGVTYDGSSRAGGMQIYVAGSAAAQEFDRDNLFKEITYGDKTALTLAARFRCRGFKGGRVDELKVFDRELTALEMAEIAGVERVTDALSRGWAACVQPASSSPADAALRGRLLKYYLTYADKEYARRRAELHRLRVEENQLIDGVPEIMVMGDLPEPRPTHLLTRGAYDAPGEVVSARAPASLSGWDPAWPQNRLGLARWLVDRQNPLTARVTVNRYWQMLFGRGLVITAENFGVQGDLPSHPELLDWLAGWFMDHDWDLKALCRLLVSSATYRQDSAATEELRIRDPENRLLARGPRRRMSAEMLRDQALATSGLLVGRVGGPSVRPYQPEGLWEEKSGTAYHQDKGEGLYRRSLYTFWKRTSPHPAMTTFDATSRETCIARRQTTSTPLQALVLLNDPQFVEAGRMLAERALREAGSTVADRVNHVFRLLTGRVAKPAELEILRELYLEQLELFRNDPGSAAALLKVGEAPVDPGLDPLELAAGTALANAVMSFEEAVKK